MHAVAAEIHERAAAKLFDVAQLAGCVRQVRIEHRLDVPDAPDGAVTQQRQRVLEQRMEAVVKAFEEMAARGFRRGDHLRGVLRIAGERLFDEHVFAVCERRRAPLEMGRGRQGDVHQVDVVACDELGITTECERQRVLRGEVLRAFEGARRDRDGLGAEQIVGRGDDAARRDSRRAQDSDAYHGAAVSHDCRRCGTLSPRN